jgi:catechol 2,3-dioxygenase-like lactoylglutathione lyase family enzyme
MAEKQGLALPSVGQIGIVVKDVDKAVNYYSKVFGVGPFTIMNAVPKKHWVKGAPFPIKLKIALAKLGSIQIELIEPLSDGPHKWFLDSNGEGLQHLGFYIDNYDEWINYLKQEGIGIFMNVEDDSEGMGHVRAAFMQSDKIGGVLIELIEVTSYK